MEAKIKKSVKKYLICILLKNISNLLDASTKKF